MEYNLCRQLQHMAYTHVFLCDCKLHILQQLNINVYICEVVLVLDMLDNILLYSANK